MSIKVSSSIEEAYVSQLNSFKKTAASGESVSFSDALASAQDLLDGQDLTDAQKNAIRAVTVDAAIDAIQLSGGYGLALDSDLAKSLGISQSTASTTSETTDTSSVEVESAADAAARNATTEAAVSAASSDSTDTSEAAETDAASAETNEADSTDATSSASYTTSADIELLSVDADNLKCSDTLNSYFEEASKTYDVDVKLLKSIAYVESNFKSDCTSSAGAMGIMQLMPSSAKTLGVSDAYDPYQNIMGGAKFLSQLLEKFDGDVALATAGYNAGPGAVAKCGGIPSSTEKYVQKVLSYYYS